MKNLSLLESNF